MSPGISFFISVMNLQSFPTISTALSGAHCYIFCIGIFFSSQNLSIALKTVVTQVSAGRLIAKIISSACMLCINHTYCNSNDLLLLKAGLFIYGKRLDTERI